jgi:hypothetical protein
MHRAFIENTWISNWLNDSKTPLPAPIVHRFMHNVIDDYRNEKQEILTLKALIFLLVQNPTSPTG